MRIHAALPHLAFWLCVAPVVDAADYAARPIRLIVPFSAGGASDTAARALAQAMPKSLGQQIVVENKPGGAGAIAAQAVIHAPPDGQTLLWGVASMAALPFMASTPPFQSLADFAPVAMVGRFAFCIVTHASVPAQTVAQFVGYARANPDKLSYASSTLSEFKSAAQFMKATGVSMVRVPYKGGSQVIPDLLAGRVQVHFGTMSSALPYTIDGRLRMLAVLLPQRSAAAPEVPTLAESGMPDISVPTWQAIFAPRGTSPEIVGRVARAVASALQGAELRAQYARQLLQIEESTPQALAALIEADAIAWRQFARDNDIKPE